MWTRANGDSLAVWVGFVRTTRAAAASGTTCSRTTASPSHQEVGHAHFSCTAEVFATCPISARLNSSTCNVAEAAGEGTSSHACVHFSDETANFLDKLGAFAFLPVTRRSEQWRRSVQTLLVACHKAHMEP